jgi:hypothetical protein
MVGVEDLDVVPGLDLAGAHFAGPGRAQPHPLRALAMHPEADALDVEDDVGHVLEHAGERGELVEDAFDLHRGDGRPLQ